MSELVRLRGKIYFTKYKLCSAQAQSPVAGTPCVRKMIFWSFLTKTKQDQALLSHDHGKILAPQRSILVRISISLFFWVTLYI